MDGWRDAIEMLSSDMRQRARVGRAARDTVEEKYSLRVWGPKVTEIIKNL